MQNEEFVSSQLLNDTGIVPTGYRMLVAIPEKDERTKGGIYIPQDAKKAEEIASLCGHVLELGPLCYRDENKFGPDLEPWCREGDYVLMAQYSGIRLRVPGRKEEYRLINDDNVCAVVSGPDGVERA